MSGTGFETTTQDIRRAEHDESKLHNSGEIPAGSAAAAAQVSLAHAVAAAFEPLRQDLTTYSPS